MIKVVFFGTPPYVIPVLDKLSKNYKITAVVTQPPKLVGRKQFREFSAVDTWAHKKKVPIFFEPAKIVEKKIEADFGILAAYGEFVPKNVINYFPHGILNIHPSLLPAWRGASPVQASILSGEGIGATVIKLDNELDHGPIISKFKDEVTQEDTTDSLRDRLFDRSAQFLIDLIPNYLNRKIIPKEQDHTQATYTTQIKKADGFIKPEYLKAAMEGKVIKEDWTMGWIKNFSLEPSAISLARFIRAMYPWPGAWTEVHLTQDSSAKADLKPKTENKKRLKILKAHVEEVSSIKLKLDTVQLEGKNPVTWEEFTRGYPEASLG